MAKAKLRHIAFAVNDLERSALFYENAFGLERVRQSDVAIMMTDGVMSVALLHLPTNNNTEQDERGRDFIGLHHVGFLVDDLDATCSAVEHNGGAYHGQIHNVGKGPETERKYRDPDGIIFDMVIPEHATTVWRVPIDAAP